MATSASNINNVKLEMAIAQVKKAVQDLSKEDNICVTTIDIEWEEVHSPADRRRIRVVKRITSSELRYEKGQ